jgi:hypothetical protein
VWVKVVWSCPTLPYTTLTEEIETSLLLYSVQIYFIERGEVEIVTVVGSQETGSQGESGNDEVRAIAAAATGGHVGSGVVRINKISGGGAFGEADFFLGRNHR